MSLKKNRSESFPLRYEEFNAVEDIPIITWLRYAICPGLEAPARLVLLPPPKLFIGQFLPTLVELGEAFGYFGTLLAS